MGNGPKKIKHKSILGRQMETKESSPAIESNSRVCPNYSTQKLTGNRTQDLPSDIVSYNETCNRLVHDGVTESRAGEEGGDGANVRGRARARVAEAPRARPPVLRRPTRPTAWSPGVFFFRNSNKIFFLFFFNGTFVPIEYFFISFYF